MAKAAVNFACTECGYAAGRWFGKCPGCNAFGSLVEETPAAEPETPAEDPETEVPADEPEAEAADEADEPVAAETKT